MLGPLFLLHALRTALVKRGIPPRLEGSHSLDLLLTVHLQLMLNVAVVIQQIGCILLLAQPFGLFDRFLAVNALQKVPIFMHIVAEVIIGEGLYFLDW